MNVFAERTHAQDMRLAETRHPDSHAPAERVTSEMDTLVQVSIFRNVSVVVMTAGDSRSTT